MRIVQTIQHVYPRNNRRPHPISALITSVIVCVVAMGSSISAQTARVFDFGDYQHFGASAINNNGQILGHFGQHMVVIGKFERINLPRYPPGSPYPISYLDINDVGQITGGIELPCQDPNGPFVNTTTWHVLLYSISTMTLSDLGSLPIPSDPCPNAYGETINNFGVIAGTVSQPPVAPYYNHIGIYANGQLIDTGVLPGVGFISNPRVNDNGQVFASANYVDSNPSGWVSHVALYENGLWTDLGVQPGFLSSGGSDINNAGDIVGTSATVQGAPVHPFILSHGVWNDLGLLPGSQICSASRINNADGIAGTCTLSNGSSVAVIYVNGSWIDVNSLLPAGSGWQIAGLYDYNDHGVMLTSAFRNGVNHYLLVDPNPDTTPPQLSVPGNFSVAAESASGALVGFNPVGVDEYSTSAGVLCDHPSGSLFPMGTTLVTCQAIDAAGNMSSAQSFAVQVIDTPPNLSLPGDVVTNATSSSGAQVTYFASADDVVSGQLTAQCSPASGSTFPIGVTAVNCSATDGAGNTSTGSFNVYVLTSDQTYTPSDYYVTIQPANGPTITFPFYVDAPGVTTVTPIDAATIGTTPAGFALSNGIAYQISTTVNLYDYVQLDFAVPGPISEADFNNLTILHNNNGTLEDVTGGRSYDAQSHSGTITAYTYSFSPFYLAKRVSNRIAPLFDQTKAFKTGSTIPVKLQLVNENDANVSAPTVTLKARNLVRLGTNTAAVVMDAGNANPDLNFRYDAGLRGYIFNLKTTGLQPGSYALSFYVGSERSFFYTVKFEVK